MSAGIMTELDASGIDRLRIPHIPQFAECLTISQGHSEIEFLHGFQSCEALLDRADKTGLAVNQGRDLLPLWIELGRPHPVTLRRLVLGIQTYRQFEFRLATGIDRKRLC